MDLRWPRVVRRSNVGLVDHVIKALNSIWENGLSYNRTWLYEFCQYFTSVLSLPDCQSGCLLHAINVAGPAKGTSLLQDGAHPYRCYNRDCWDCLKACLGINCHLDGSMDTDWVGYVFNYTWLGDRGLWGHSRRVHINCHRESMTSTECYIYIYERIMDQVNMTQTVQD